MAHDYDDDENDDDEYDDGLIIGDYNELEVVRFVDFGLYLESRDGDILLPKSKVPAGTEIGEFLRVFIYKDSENRLIATTDTPKVTVDHCALLEVMDVNKYGAFMDWGIDNQLLVPYREQTTDMQIGSKYLIYLYLDHVSDRLVGSMRLEKFLDNDDLDLSIKDKVDLYIFQRSPLGYKAVINQHLIGLLYENELDRPVQVGDQLTGYIKNIREDGKIDLTLKQMGFGRVLSIPDKLIAELKKNDGFLALNDKSPPEAIKAKLHISKSDFKKAVGILLKKKIIAFERNGIVLLP